MHTIPRFLVVVSLSCASALSLGEVDRSKIDASLESVHPGAKLTSLEVGDLNADGVADLAYIVERLESDEHEVCIGVLRGTLDGFSPWTHTKWFPMGQRSPELSISNQSLFINVFRNGLSWGNWQTDQYSFRNGQLVLIGTEVIYRSPRLEIEAGPVTLERTSTNYLTGIEIRSRSEGGKRSSESVHHKLERLRPLEQYGQP